MEKELASGGADTFQPLRWKRVFARREARAVGRQRSLNPRWSVRADPQVQELARFTDGPVAVARRTHAGFESIYAGTLGLPAAALRRLCRDAARD